MVGKYKVITLCGSTRFKDAQMYYTCAVSGNAKRPRLSSVGIG